MSMAHDYAIPNGLSEASESLKAVLLDMGVKPGHVRVSVQRSEMTGEPLPKIMRDFGFLSGEQVAEALARLTGFEYLPAEYVEQMSREDIQGIHLDDFRRYVPIGRTDDGELVVAVPDESAINDARNEFFKERVRIVIASEHTIQTVFRKYFANSEKAFDASVDKFMRVVMASRRSDEDTEGAGLVREVFGALLRHACYSGASDLYLYKSEDVGIVRLKINGVGQIFRSIDPTLFNRILNKLVTENTKSEDLRREPKESVVEFSDEDKRRYEDITSRFGFRLELAETRGERTAVIRILDKQSTATELSRLGFDDYTYKALRRISNTSTGLFLVTGPTGSGKTTTLYAALKNIDPVERSIQSIEDPVEYKHGLWQQYELRKDATDKAQEYNKWLKALLRNAPDVILVGEVRDGEVAQILMDAANTGHLAFATLHTNNAPMALARLKRLGVDMPTLASVLLGILAQRLVRVLCPHCKVKDPSKDTLAELDTPWLEGNKHNPYKAGGGCPHCDFSGYKGRRMLYEVLELNAEVQRLIEEDAPPSVIAKAGIPAGRTMWGCGLKLVSAGVTSLEEVERVAKRDA